jgi:hypothetical protein
MEGYTMNSLHKLENTVAGWFKQAPHLPSNVTKWLSDNVWWLTLVGVAISVFGILALIPFLLGVSVLTSSYALYAGVDVGRTMLAYWVSFGFLVAVVAIEAMAIMPLKAKKKQGWDLLFLAVLVSILSSLVGFVVTYGVSNIFGAVLTALIGGYFLFEIRGSFTASKSK